MSRVRSSSRCAVSGIRPSDSAAMCATRRDRRPACRGCWWGRDAGAGGGCDDLGRRSRRRGPPHGLVIVVEARLVLEFPQDVGRLPAELRHGLAQLPCHLGEPLGPEHHERDHEDHCELGHPDAEHHLRA